MAVRVPEHHDNQRQHADEKRADHNDNSGSAGLIVHAPIINKDPERRQYAFYRFHPRTAGEEIFLMKTPGFFRILMNVASPKRLQASRHPAMVL